jgi:hypothetical protein
MPNPEMTAPALVELLHHFESAALSVWLDGGWGVDIVLSVADVPKLRELLAVRGFAVREGKSPHSWPGWRSVACPRRRRCWATRTVMCRWRRTFATWNALRSASASSCRRNCGEQAPPEDQVLACLEAKAGGAATSRRAALTCPRDDRAPVAADLQRWQNLPRSIIGLLNRTFFRGAAPCPILTRTRTFCSA